MQAQDNANTLPTGDTDCPPQAYVVILQRGETLEAAILRMNLPPEGPFVVVPEKRPIGESASPTTGASPQSEAMKDIGTLFGVNADMLHGSVFALAVLVEALIDQGALDRGRLLAALSIYYERFASAGVSAEMKNGLDTLALAAVPSDRFAQDSIASQVIRGGATLQ